MSRLLFSARVAASVLGCAAFVGCGGAASSPAPEARLEAPSEGDEAPVDPAPAPEAAPLAAVPGPLSIARSLLVPELDAGLGRFLGTVRVAAVLERGAFVGFRIVAFRDPAGRYSTVDLRPGDVVTRVNGSPIERPEQALAVWNGLRVVSELCVEYVRDGARREIRYAIVD